MLSPLVLIMVVKKLKRQRRRARSAVKTLLLRSEIEEEVVPFRCELVLQFCFSKTVTVVVVSAINYVSWVIESSSDLVSSDG